MAEVKVLRTARLGDCIVFKNKKYSTSKLMRLAGPMLEISPGDLHADSNSLVEGYPDVLNADYSLPLVNKYEGFYVVLLGRKAFEQAIIDKQPIKCKLISNPTLKNAVVL